MLRINLLPPYIYEGKRKKQLVALWSIVGAVAVGGFLLWLSNLNTTLADETAKLEKAKQLQTEYNNLNTKIDGVKKEIADTKQKQTFIADAQTYNDSWRPAFMMVRDVVNPRIVINSVNFDQSRSAVNMGAFAPSELDAIRWWMVLLNQTDKFTNVNITLPPHAYVPDGATGATAGGGAPGSFGGGRMSMPPGGMGPSGSMGAMMGARGAMGGASFGGAVGGNNANAGNTSVLEGRNGFEFVCTAGLVTPLKGGSVAPSWPPANTGAGPGGMSMGPSGSMGSMMGMSGGMSGGMSAPAPARGGRGGGTAD